jgi:hypothetical protein
MELIALLYVAAALFTGISAMFNAGSTFGLCGALSPLLALIAGGGITSAVRDGNYPRLGGVVAVGAVLFAASLYWVSQQGWTVVLKGHTVSGTAEVVVGFVIGLLFGLMDRPGWFSEKIHRPST